MKTIMTVKEASALIEWGRPLLIAGAERLLSRLPRGPWIGGTIPYFMSEEGGVQTAERVFVTRFPDFCRSADLRLYGPEELSRIPADYPDNGVSFVILPAGSAVHVRYARDCTSWPGLFDRPLAGWVSGVDLEELATATPLVFNGTTGERSNDAAAVMHLKLPAGLHANVSIVNLFEQGSGDRLTFPETGFEAERCFVNGEPRNFAEYLLAIGADRRWPLVANYAGAKVNVGFQGLDAARKRVTFYAPVFEGIEYRLAKSPGDFRERFGEVLDSRRVVPLFTCNCILNYLYAHLEGRRTGEVVGPITFGEIAWMLLSQTLVYVTLDAAD